MEANTDSALTIVEIRERVVALKAIIQAGREEIANLQKQCTHENKRKVWRQLKTDRYQFNVAGYRCADCTKNFDKQGGDRCAICDGPEKLMGYIPGQGGGEHVYKCKDCGRSSTSNEYGVYQRRIPEHDFIEG